MDYSRPALADALAAAYVAGTLRGAARRRFAALLPAHPALRDAVAAWQARLMPMTAVITPVPPPARVWQQIERRLWPAAAAPAPGPVAPGGWRGWWQGLALWRGVSALATAAALSLAVLLSVPQPVSAPVVIVLQATGAGAVGGPGHFVASVSGDGRAFVTRPLAPVAMAGDRVLELWSVPPQGKPQSLGLISASGVTVLAPGRLPATLLSGGTDALAVSVEPPGGSPTGVPTGPVVFAGKLQS
jgi:anti-sigma-K factor RskA